MPLHLFRDESLEEFQTMIREMFLSDDRVATKAYLKIFIEKIMINLPRIDITYKSNVLLIVTILLHLKCYTVILRHLKY